MEAYHYIWDSTVGEDRKEDYGTAEAGPKTAFLTGVYLPFEVEKLFYSFKAQYTEFDHTTYTFPYDQDLVYKYGESWLGHWGGPDSKSLVLELKGDYANGWEAKMSYTALKKGVKISPEKDLDIYTLRAAKSLNKNKKITAYLQRSIGDDFLKAKLILLL
ncbi:hypothetical protein [Halanaerobium sp. ST460_2HS_T2]|uniref:hypothetical protein n=1 Tax=Halanaerobium sp. ST460_2HS_T2 TaxID=2183914 RepID=UPI000DF34D45|nr:hypothetical protein [Halanaerobium sp. ST460_2HS_T2]RCW49807.1 hypothetical protein DFR80_1546 [Halanaerobium sp. ST460_2HS_T2]